MSNNYYQTPQSEVNQVSQEGNLGTVKSCSSGTGMNWVGESWRLFKSQPGVWIGMFLVYMIIMMVLSWIPLINFLSSLIAPIFTAGWMIAAVNCDHHGSAKLDDLFAGFSKNTGTLILVGVISLLIEVAIGMVVGLVFASSIGMNEMMSMTSDPQKLMQYAPLLAVFILLFAALVLPVIMLVWFAPVLIVQHNLAAWDAMSKSFMGCLKNVLPLTLYSIIMLVLLFLGMIPLLLGLLIVMPMLMISVYAAYKDIFLE